MTALAVYIAGLVLAAAILFTGGWILRGERDRRRAERWRRERPRSLG